MSLRRRLGPLKSLVRVGIPVACIVALARPGADAGQRPGAAALLLAYWTFVYGMFRTGHLEDQRQERELLRAVPWDAFWRHLDQRTRKDVDPWGLERNRCWELSRDLVDLAVRDHLPRRGCVLDVGFGADLAADRVLASGSTYLVLGVREGRSGTVAPGSNGIHVRGDATRMPLADASIDVVVMNQVMGRMLRPESAVWEVSRVLRPGGVLIATARNASAIPNRSPLSHLFLWIEKVLGSKHPALISHRPWVRPEALDPSLHPDVIPPVFLPDTYHIAAETRGMLAAGGLETSGWSSFEFPPARSVMARSLERRGDVGSRILGGIEWIARRTPLIRRLGGQLFLLARKTGASTSPEPPIGVWPGPVSPEGRRGSITFDESSDPLGEPESGHRGMRGL